MKTKKATKDRLVSTRMTDAQYRTIKSHADQRNMHVSSFMVHTACHCDAESMPLHAMRLQNLANMAADACAKTNPELAAQIRREADAVWQF